MGHGLPNTTSLLDVRAETEEWGGRRRHYRIQIDGPCNEDGPVNSDLLCVSECGATARIRRATGLSLYFSSCSIKGLSAAKAYSNFVLGLDCKGEEISMADYRERGRTLAAVFKSVMGDHWGWSFLLLYYREPDVR